MIRVQAPLVWTCGAVGIAAVLLWGAFTGWIPLPALSGHVAATGPTPAEERAPAPGPAPASPESLTDRVEFPREQWNSAGIVVRPVLRGELVELIELTGKVSLNEDKLSHVFPLVEGRVDAVKIQFGQQVKQGDLLVVVQSKEVGQGRLQLYQDRLKREFAEARDKWTQEAGRNARAMIDAMRREASIEELDKEFHDRPMGDHREKLMTAYVAYLKARAHVERLSPIAQSGAVAARQVLEAESELNGTRATLKSLQEQISQDAVQAAATSIQTLKELRTSIAVSEATLKILGFSDADLQDIDPARQGENLAHYPVTAPFDGTVISKDVVLLERVSPDRQILTIADLSSVWITADIYERHLPLLTKLRDLPVRLRCEAWPGRDFEARVFYTGDLVQETTRTIALKAVATNKEGLLKPGMFVTVCLPNLETKPVLQVPLSAIQDHEGKSFVFVQSGDGEFVRRDVELGRRNREVVEVRSGLKVQEPVVVSGGFALKSRLLADLLAE